MAHDPSLADPDPEGDRSARCAGKERFDTGALAQRVAKRRKYRGASPYRCPHCNGFHIGRRSIGKRVS